MKGYIFSYDVDKEPEFITRCLIRKKDDILEVLQNTKEQKLSALKKSNKHSSAYYSIYESLYNGFIEDIKKTPIMTIADSWWYYAIEENQRGIKLRTSVLKEFSFQVSNGKACFRGHTTSGGYVVAELSLRELTVEEYAEKYDVEPVTVRQWIRRGKLRSAKKIGNEWRIPESTDIPKRGYEPCTYSMSLDYQRKRNEIKSQYDFMKDANHISIVQDEQDKNKYIVTYDRYTEFDQSVIEMNSKDREKLELFLISTPYFEYSGRDSSASYYETKDGDNLFDYLYEHVTVEDLENTGPGIEAEDQFNLDMKIDGFAMDDDKIFFQM